MTDPSLTIRSAAPADGATVHAFVDLLESHVGARAAMPSTPEDMARLMEGPCPVLHAELLERDGRPVAMVAWMRVCSTWWGRTGLFLTDVVVADEERGRGHARRLIAHMAAKAVAEGAAFVKLEVDHGNDDAGAVYRRLGFEASSSDAMFLKDEALERLAGGG